MKNRQKGFSMIEMLFALAAFGILSGLAISGLSEAFTQKQVKKGISEVARIKAGIESVYLETGAVPSDRSAAGLSALPTDTQTTLISSLSILNGTISIVYGNRAHPDITNLTVDLVPYSSQDGMTISWGCANRAMPAGLSKLGTFAPDPGSEIAAHGITTVPNELLPTLCRAA